MTFKHTLSRRLALLRDAATVAALAVVASCDLFSPVDTSGLDVPQVVVVPSSMALEPEQNYQFAVYGRTKDGDSVAVAVAWSTTSGTISSSGQYVADSLEGDYEVRATLVGFEANATTSSGSSLVRVRKLAQLLVTPASATLPSGGTQAFAAYGRLKNGDSVAVTVAWSATGGSISSAGLYTAGPTSGQYAVAATGKSLSTVSSVTLTTIPVASVSVSPPSATLSVGATQQLSAVTKDSAGNTLTGRVVTWASSNPAVATVSGSGLVTAIAAGSATITATSEGKNGTSTITVQAPPPPPGSRVGYYVAPNVSPTGNGSATQPWNLATALAHPAAVQPGDTIWLRGGTYTGTFTSSLTGSVLNPIIIRQYPGERAIIDGNLKHLTGGGSDTWWWGFEVTKSTGFLDTQAIEARQARTKYINLIIHDHEGTGIGFWLQATDSELYGTLIYNNGRQTQHANSFSHGIYTANGVGGTKLIKDCILFHNLGYDLHMYGTAADLVNFTVDGNIGINPGGTNGGWIATNDASSSLFQNISFNANMIYGFVWGPFGPDTPSSSGRLSLTDNYVIAPTGLTVLQYLSQLTNTGNTLATWVTRLFAGATYPTSPDYVYNNNAYFGKTGNLPPNSFLTWRNGVQHLANADLATWRSATGYDLASTQTITATGKPTTNRVFVRPNQYEAGRANIAIFNYQGLASVPVDVSGVLTPGDHYEVRNVQNFFGTPTLSGTYAGGSISIPMTAVTPAPPLGGWPNGAPRVTGPEFNAFVVLRTSP